jgi:hypothetical protein
MSVARCVMKRRRNVMIYCQDFNSKEVVATENVPPA